MPRPYSKSNSSFITIFRSQHYKFYNVKQIIILYQTITSTHDHEEKGLLDTLWGKEKMVVPSIFSFSYNIFFPSKNKFQILSPIYHVVFNLVMSKVLLFGKDLQKIHQDYNAKWDDNARRRKIIFNTLQHNLEI